jgi:tRNA(fMet)-specific endonuclease VapC
MARHLIDTSSLIDYSKRSEPAASTIRNLIATGEELGVIDVIIAEFFSGVPAHERPRWDTFLEEFEHWPCTYEAAVRAGNYRYVYARRGIAIGTPDALIAAIAAEVGATLVTNNAKDFPMPDVILLVPSQANVIDDDVE